MGHCKGHTPPVKPESSNTKTLSEPSAVILPNWASPTPPPPFPPTDMSIKSVSVLPLAQQRELLTAWNCRWMDTRKQDLHNSSNESLSGRRGWGGRENGQNLLHSVGEDLVPKNIPHGWGGGWNSGPPRGLGVGDRGRQESISPHSSTEAKMGK